MGGPGRLPDCLRHALPDAAARSGQGDPPLREAQDGIGTRILRSGSLALDPPGLTVEVAALSEDDPPA
jgi:hypothetical protein